ncbi:MAG: hypothetical protein JWQ45_2230 [Blastococcus sp.]|nr:hypothetical protein [Blastococcus sp.]
MIVKARLGAPASDDQLGTEVGQVLDRRGALKHPPVSLAVSDAVALAIAGIFRSPTPSGQVLDRFFRQGVGDSQKLIEAAQAEQGYASAEGHAALYCLIGWVRAQVHKSSE